MNTLSKSAIEWLTHEIQEIALGAVSDTFMFFKLIGTDIYGAAHYFGKAAATLFVLFLVFRFLIKLTKKLDHLGAGITSVGVWVTKALSGTSSYFARVLAITVKKFVRGGLRLETYKRFFAWCAMMPPQISSEISRGAYFGFANIAYQRGLGGACLLVAIWSSAAFGYALYTALLGGGSEINKGFYLAILLGSLLYGALIFSLDRSIAVPQPMELHVITPATSQFRIVATKAMAVFRFICRIGIALMIARFTALPLTLLVLSGGIQNEIDERNRIASMDRATRVTAVDQVQQAAIDAKRASITCRSAQNALDNHDKLTNDEAYRCKDSLSTKPCVGDKTIYLEGKRLAYVNQRTESCELTNVEVQGFANRRNDIAAVSPQTWRSPPDILVGGQILDALRDKFPSSYNPVTATFWVLFVIELIPIFMKLWQPIPVTRRSQSERRKTAQPILFTDRRVGIRRAA
jgi:hypothetical protein